MELRPAHLSLEEIFLQLTTSDTSADGRRRMRNVWAVAMRELRSYFLSPLAYVVIALFLALSGYLFALILANGREASLTRPGAERQRAVPVHRAGRSACACWPKSSAPGTVELLLTNPVQEWEIVTGKFLASIMLVLVMLGLTLLFPLFLFIFGSPDSGPIITGYLGHLPAGGGVPVGRAVGFEFDPEPDRGRHRLVRRCCSSCG